MFFSMFLYVRYLLIDDTFIFESSFLNQSFLHLKSIKIHFPPTIIQQWLVDPYLFELLFDFRGLWGEIGPPMGELEIDFDTLWGLPGVAFFLSELLFFDSSSSDPAITLVIFITEPLRSQFASKNELQIVRKSIQNRSNIHHTCMSGFNFSFSLLFHNFFFQRPKHRTFKIIEKRSVLACFCTLGICLQSIV